MLAIDSQFTDGTLTLTDNAGDDWITVDTANVGGTDYVRVNGSMSEDDAGQNIKAAEVARLEVYGQSGDDEIDLSAVSASVFPQLDADDEELPSVVIDGGAGADTIVGSGLDDQIDGGEGHDTLAGDLGDDTIDGGEGNDTLEGGRGDDRLLGNDGDDDYIYRGVFAPGDEDALGHDTIIEVAEQGTDTLDFSQLDVGNGVRINLGIVGIEQEFTQMSAVVLPPPPIDPGEILQRTAASAIPEPPPIPLAAQTITLGQERELSTNIENVIGTGYADAITGNELENELRGLDNSTSVDWIKGEGGNDTLYGGLGTDVIEGGAGNDEIYGEEGGNELHGGPGNDTIEGGSDYDELYGDADKDVLIGWGGDDLLVGGSGNDELRGAGGDDQLYGGADDDTLYGSGHNDLLEGGTGNDKYVFEGPGQQLGEDVIVESTDPGIDILDFSGLTHPAGVEIDLTTSEQQIVYSEETYHFALTLNGAANFENVNGTIYDDTIIGNAADNVLAAGDGNDHISVGAGDDQAFGGLGDDWLEGGDHNDLLEAGDGNDVLFASPGADDLVGGDGNDTYVFRGDIPLGQEKVYELDGMDTLDFSGLDLGGGVNVDLSSPTGIQIPVIGGTISDLLLHHEVPPRIENVLGTPYGDILTGSFASNLLDGSAGDDVITGGEGDDVISAGTGSDILAGGDGNDRYVLHDAPTGTDSDEIDDTSGIDSVDLGGLLSGAILQLANTNTQIINANLTLLLHQQSIENVAGSIHNDEIYGANDDNVLNGNLGNDILHGLGGNDALIGHAGNDTLLGGDGNDVLAGGIGDDILVPGDGADVNDGSFGTDEYVVTSTEEYEDDEFLDVDQDIAVTDSQGGNSSNHFPVLAPIQDMQVDAEDTISYQISAFDSDLPEQTLLYSLDGLSPSGASLTTSGLFTWTPTHDQADAHYTIGVRVTDNGSPSLSTKTAFSVDVVQTGPDIPANPHITTDIDSVTVWWEAVDGATTYHVQRKATGTSWIGIGSSTGTNYVDSPIEQGARYQYRVASANAMGQSPYTIPLSVTTPIRPPLYVNATLNQENTSVILDWTYGIEPAIDLLGHRIERFLHSNSQNAWENIASVSGAERSYVDASPPAGAVYYRVLPYGPDAISHQGFQNAFVAGINGIAYAIVPLAGQVSLNTMLITQPSNAALLQGEPYTWFNEIEEEPTVAEAIRNVARAGIDSNLSLDPFEIRYTFEEGIQNNPGDDLILMARSRTRPFRLTHNGRTAEITGPDYSADVNLFRGCFTQYHVCNGQSDPIDFVGYQTFDLDELSVLPGDSIDSILVDAGDNSILGIGPVPRLIDLDLSIDGLDDDEEVTIGALLPVNDNRDEGNVDAMGFPLLDNEPDFTDGHRIVGPYDAQLLAGRLNILYSGMPSSGTWSLTFPDSIRIWRSDAGQYTEVDSGSSISDLSSFGGQQTTIDGPLMVELLIEGIDYSNQVRDISIVAEFIPENAAIGEVYQDEVRLTAPKLEYVSWDPETGEVVDVEEVQFVSELRPEVDLSVKSAHLDRSGNLVVTAQVHVYDSLSELAYDPADRIQRIVFYANHHIVDAVSDLAVRGTPGIQPWQPYKFDFTFERTFVIPPRISYHNQDKQLPWTGDGVLIRAETSPNAAGNVGWDKSAVIVGLRHEDDFSPGMGNPHASGEMTVGDGNEITEARYYPVIEKIEDLEGSREGSFYPTVVRVTALDDELASRIQLSQNGAQQELKSFTFSPPKHYVVQQGSSGKLKIYVLTSDELKPSMLQALTS